jgi:tetratricopeptide (TPR) repeat protein
VRWKPFRRERSRDDQLAERTAAAEIAYGAGRYELAKAEFEAVVAAHRERLAERPDDVEATELLAAGLNGLALCLEALRGFDEATALREEGLERSERAVALRRAVREGADPELARALRTFALVRADAGVELDEAATALEEALAVHMAVLAATPDRLHLEQTYATELARARLLARQGRPVEAARVAELARSGHLDGLVDMLRGQRGP